jgi:V8-like Glu-specific endopeptidase
VLTSQHILGQRASPIGRRLTFTGALGSKREVSSTGTVVAAGGYEKHQAADQRSEARGTDWLLLRLDTCLGAALGYATLRVGPKTAWELTSVESAGYPMGRSRRAGLTVDPSCQIRAVYALVWLNDCATLHGNSGGPIFRLSASGGRQQLEVFAIQSAGILQRKVMPFRQGWENQATPVSMILPQIRSYLSPRLSLTKDARDPPPVPGGTATDTAIRSKVAM